MNNGDIDMVYRKKRALYGFEKELQQEIKKAKERKKKSKEEDIMNVEEE